MYYCGSVVEWWRQGIMYFLPAASQNHFPVGLVIYPVGKRLPGHSLCGTPVRNAFGYIPSIRSRKSLVYGPHLCHSVVVVQHWTWNFPCHYITIIIFRYMHTHIIGLVHLPWHACSPILSHHTAWLHVVHTAWGCLQAAFFDQIWRLQQSTHILSRSLQSTILFLYTHTPGHTPKLF